MRVTIEHTTKKVGIFKSAPIILLTVEFTDVEKASIQKSGLAEYVVHQTPLLSRLPERMQGPIYVKHLVRGPQPCEYEDPAAARADEVKLREALKTLKDNIDANAQPVKDKVTFEL